MTAPRLFASVTAVEAATTVGRRGCRRLLSSADAPLGVAPLGPALCSLPPAAAAAPTTVPASSTTAANTKGKTV
eukprot:CAMPEP_0198700628 /NCGR_PEP_ID=MMETSP1468-20131203/372534_1 /TAXON_ID=1461545 /ORGANISM="Mantoniella sp, Strain CCMP1436" /LENGTH=73 /DNA_ID=CAMNT_0044458639 /DNA_START=3 /DNA_END=224 /DNA_ORIENTATION=+